MELADYATDSVILYNLEGRVQYCNAATESLYGWTATALLGSRFSDLMLEHFESSILWENLVRIGHWAGPLRRRSLSGHEISANVRLAVRHDPHGNPLDVVEYSAPSTTTNVNTASPPLLPGSGRVACWQFNLKRARSLLDGVDAAVGGGVKDREWHPDRLDILLTAVQITDVNDEAIRLFGLADRDRVIDRPVASLWPEQSRAALDDLLTTIAAKTDTDPETRQIPVVGRLQHVVLTGWRAADPRCPDTVFVHVKAVLNTPSAVIELEASQIRYRNLISYLPVPVWQIDARAAGRIFDRLRAGGVTDMATYSDEHPELVDLTCEIVQIYDVNNEAILLFGGKDRSEFIGPVKYLFSSTPGSGRRVMLAHFSGARNHVEELKVRTFDGRLLDVLLLVTFPVPAGKRAPTYALLGLNDVVRECLVFLRHESEDKNVVIKATLEPNLPSFRGDRIQLQQIIVNLIVNSIQAMKAAPQTRREIYLETGLDEKDHVALSIRDTGTGIPIDHMEQIFDGFFTTKEGGGIGLAICQSIVKAHGGTIQAANHPDGGAVFRFSIPTESAATAVDSSASSEYSTQANHAD